MNGFFDGMDDNKGSKQIVDREWVRPGDYLVNWKRTVRRSARSLDA